MEHRKFLLTTFPVCRSLTNAISPMPGLSFVQPPELRKRSCPRGRLFANLKLLEYMMKLNAGI